MDRPDLVILTCQFCHWRESIECLSVSVGLEHLAQLHDLTGCSRPIAGH